MNVTITPGPLAGAITPPPSKSQAHRLLIAAALGEVCAIALVNTGAAFGGTDFFRWKAILLAAAVFVCLQVGPLKKLHPIAFIAASAVLGVLFQF